ncbi:hypothetical protein Dsin_016865 [Dipteronia sinensis]|uniref:Uncharacterized protein n=1 Tax=Dipteronia sinensis TaxID=43782 RepID=A0AAE0AE76_9ROSI|nr:hypothetical protein Dsin_016865 [Dipteronia sinensis]
MNAVLAKSPSYIHHTCYTPCLLTLTAFFGTPCIFASTVLLSWPNLAKDQREIFHPLNLALYPRSSARRPCYPKSSYGTAPQEQGRAPETPGVEPSTAQAEGLVSEIHLKEKELERLTGLWRRVESSNVEADTARNRLGRSTSEKGSASADYIVDAHSKLPYYSSRNENQ